MRGVNKVFLIGNCGADPDTRYNKDGGAITKLSVATSWKNADKEGVEWHRVVAFGRLAEIMGKYLKKGSQVYIEGRLQTQKWQDKDGNDRYTTEVIANDMQMLSTKEYVPGEDRTEPVKTVSFDDDIPF